jgi:gliding motility-associated-like protein
MKSIRFVLFIFLNSICFNSLATHIVGGEIYYDCLGNNNYKITLKIYRDCCPSCSQFDSPSAVIGVYDVNGINLQTIDMGLPLVTQLQPSINNPCVTLPTNVCVEEGLYQKIVNLPPIAGGYILSYQRCCRNSSIINVFDAPNVGSTYEIHILDNSLVQCNSSPRYNLFPPLFICQFVPLNFNHSASDPDGDSLYYEMCTPFEGADPIAPQPVPPSDPPYTFVSYNAPYSGSYPMSSSPALSVNSTTGLLTGTPNMIGRWVVGICVKEYRNGILLTTNKRDFQFNVVNCPNIPVASIPNQQVFCTGFTVNFSQASLNAFTYHWDFGVPGIVTDTSNLQSPSYTYPTSGTYTVSLIINPGSICADTASNVFNIQPLLNPSFVAPSQQCLNGNNFSFTAGGAFQGNGTFSWNFGPNANPSSSNLQNPTIIHFTTAGTQTVTLTIVENGCTKTFSNTVNILPAPTASFTTSTVVGCALNPVQFTNTSTGAPPLSYFWNFANGQTSIATNPTATYTAQGTYDVQLIATTPNGCTDTLALANQLFIVDSTVALFTATTNCNNYNVSFISQNSIGAIFYGWNFGDVSTSNDTSSLQNPTYTFPGPGTYSVTLVANPGSDCTDQVIIPVTLLPIIQPNFIAPVGQCDYSNSFSFNGTGSFNNNPTFNWNFGPNATPSSSNLQNPSNVVFNSAGTYSVTFSVSSNGCTQSISQTVEVYPQPIANFGLVNTVGCELQPVYFADSSIATTPITYFWNFGNGQTSTSQNPFTTYNAVGNYTVSLVTTSSVGCKDTAYLLSPLAIFPSPTAGFNFFPKDTNIYYPIVTVYNQSIGSTGCQFFWGDGASSLFCDTTHTYASVGTYNLMQVVSNNFGCYDTAYAKFKIIPPFYFWIPNAFTPNGNGLNDVFKPVLEGVYDYSFMIFDRWGELVFKTNDYKEGWNGFYKEALATNDVFVYKINFKDIIKDKQYQYIGSVTLVR